MKINTLIIVSLMLLSSTLFAQFTVDGQFRTRFQALHGYKVPVKAETNATFGADQRSRLIMNYKTDKYSTRFTLQDARIFGGDDMYNPTGVAGNSGSFGVYEAWVELKLKGNSSLRIGRQEWNYDDMRILCWRNWWTSGLSYDGLLYKMHNKESGLFIDLGISYNNDGSRIGLIDNSSWDGSKIKTMNFLNIKKKFNEKLSVSLMLTLSGKEDMKNGAILGVGTHGISAKYNKGKKGTDGIFADFSAYYQHGTDMKRGSKGDYKTISAYLVAAELGFRTMEKKLELSAGVELMSGRDYKNTDEDYNNVRHSFDLQYSGRYPYYGGHINHFIVQDSYKTGTKGGGYMDPYFKVKYKLNKKSTVMFSYFMPMLTTDVIAHTSIDPTTKKPTGIELDDAGEKVYWNGGLGSYIDLGYKHVFSKEIILKVGVSYAMVSDVKNQMVYGYKDVANKTLNDMGQNYFGWAMLIIKPKFFNSAK